MVALAAALCLSASAGGLPHIARVVSAYLQTQDMKPTYLNEMPSVERVMREAQARIQPTQRHGR